MSTNSDSYPRHHRSEVDVRAEAQVLFAHLDDHRRLAGHMEKPSLMILISNEPQHGSCGELLEFYPA